MPRRMRRHSSAGASAILLLSGLAATSLASSVNSPEAVALAEVKKHFSSSTRASGKTKCLPDTKEGPLAKKSKAEKEKTDTTEGPEGPPKTRRKARGVTAQGSNGAEGRLLRFAGAINPTPVDDFLIVHAPAPSPEAPRSLGVAPPKCSDKEEGECHQEFCEEYGCLDINYDWIDCGDGVDNRHGYNHTIPPPYENCNATIACGAGTCCSKHNYCGILEEHCAPQRGCVSGCWDEDWIYTGPPHGHGVIPIEGGKDSNPDDCDCSEAEPSKESDGQPSKESDGPDFNGPKCDKYNPCEGGLCCSKYGYCGDTEEYCVYEVCVADCDYDVSHSEPECDETTPCERGCCSRYGHCGRSAEHCAPEKDCKSGCWDLDWAEPVDNSKCECSEPKPGKGGNGEGTPTGGGGVNSDGDGKGENGSPGETGDNSPGDGTNGKPGKDSTGGGSDGTGETGDNSPGDGANGKPGEDSTGGGSDGTGETGDNSTGDGANGKPGEDSTGDGSDGTGETGDNSPGDDPNSKPGEDSTGGGSNGTVETGDNSPGDGTIGKPGDDSTGGGSDGTGETGDKSPNDGATGKPGEDSTGDGSDENEDQGDGSNVGGEDSGISGGTTTPEGSGTKTGDGDDSEYGLGCEHIANGTVYVTDFDATIVFKYELAYVDDIEDAMDALNKMMQGLLEKDLIDCPDDDNGEERMLRDAVKGVDQSHATFLAGRELKVDGVVGVAPPLSSVNSNTCTETTYGAGADCATIDGEITLYLQEGTDSEVAKEGAIEVIKDGMDDGDFIDPSQGIVNVTFLESIDPPGDGLVAGGDAASAIGVQSDDDDGSGLGIGLAVASVLLVLIFALLALRKRKTSNTNTEEGFLDDVDVYSDDSNKYINKTIITDVGSFENDLRTPGTLPEAASPSWSDTRPRVLGEDDAFILDDLHQAEHDVDQRARLAEGDLYAPPTDDDLGGYHSGINVHSCTSATCELCARRKDPIFVTSTDILGNSGDSISSGSGNGLNGDQVRRTYPMDDTIDL